MAPKGITIFVSRNLNVIDTLVLVSLVQNERTPCLECLCLYHVSVEWDRFSFCKTKMADVILKLRKTTLFSKMKSQYT